MIKDELIELFLEMAVWCRDSDNCPGDVLDRVNEMERRINNGEMYLLGETKDEFTTTLAADYLGISRPTLMKYIKDGKLEAHKVGRHHRIKKTDLERFAAQRREEQYTALQELWKLEKEYGIHE